MCTAARCICIYVLLIKTFCHIFPSQNYRSFDWFNDIIHCILSSSHRLLKKNKKKSGSLRFSLELNPIRPSRLLTRSHNEFLGERGGSGGVWHTPVCPRELWLPLDTSWMHKPAMQRCSSPQWNGPTGVASFIFSAQRKKMGLNVSLKCEHPTCSWDHTFT